MQSLTRILVMTKSISCLLGCFLLVLGAGGASASPWEFYVAPGGADSSPGTLDRPFATLEKARDAVRERKRAVGLPTGGATIWLRGGQYPRVAPLVLSPEDSGETGKPLVIAAYRDEKPVVLGGRRIAGLQATSDGVWQVVLPEAKQGGWIFRTLYVNGRRYTLARSPNRGYYRMGGAAPDATSPASGPDAGKSKSAFRAALGTIQAWPDPASINLKVWNSWWTALHPLKQVDPATGVVQLAGPARRPIPNHGLSPFVVENHPGALDEPGEWQLDRASGLLRILPRPGDDLGKAEVFAPAAEHLMELAGEPSRNRWVERIELRGIAFRCTTWTLPPEGYDDTQAAVGVGAVIEATGARNCLWDRCELAQTDSYAFWLKSGCRDCTIRQCHLHDLGAGGVKIGESRKEEPELAAGGNRVENCFIHNAGHVHGSGVGVWIGASSDNVVTHNEICDFWYTGVSVGWMWATALNGTRNNRVTHNHIHHVMQRLDDGGGIYCLGLQPLSVLANNCIHDVGRDGARGKGHGIYLDEGSAAILVENNLIYDVQGGAVRLQVGTSCNTITNNICAFARRFQVDMEVARTNVFIANIVYWSQGKLFRYDKWPHYEKFISRNVYWCTDGKPILFAGLPWEQWRAMRQAPAGFYKGVTMDEGSVVADPRFVDVAGRDFRLKPGSPALGRGFRPIDRGEIGLTGDEAWRRLPSRARTEIPQEDDPGLTFAEDFERLPLGAKPPYASMEEDPGVPGAMIGVSDEQAAGGTKSLKFVDRPGQRRAWTPCFVVRPGLTAGVVVLQFDMLLQTGGRLRVEGRDEDTPAGMQAGPRLEIDAKGQVLVAGKPLSGQQVRTGQWLHVEIRCPLGPQPGKTWSLRIAPKQGEPLVADGLPCDERFEHLGWLGFMSNGTADGVFYIDNLSLALAR